MDRSCIWAPLCTNITDSYDQCPYYSTKYKEDNDPDKAESVFLLDQISKERNRRFSQPMIPYGSKYECYDEILDEPSIKFDNKISGKMLTDLAINYAQGEVREGMVGPQNNEV